MNCPENLKRNATSNDQSHGRNHRVSAQVFGHGKNSGGHASTVVFITERSADLAVLTDQSLSSAREFPWMFLENLRGRAV